MAMLQNPQLEFVGSNLRGRLAAAGTETLIFRSSI